MDCDMLLKSKSESDSDNDVHVNEVESNDRTHSANKPVIFDKPTSRKRKCLPR